MGSRLTVTGAVLAGAVALFAMGGIGRTAGATLAAPAAGRISLSPAERTFLAEVDRVRAAHGAGRLAPDPCLTSAARGHSHDMVERHYLAHGRFWVRVERCGLTRGRLGETLGWTALPAGAPRRVVAAWLASPEHRPILLDPTYQAVGIGVAYGAFEGHPHALVVTADFLDP